MRLGRLVVEGLIFFWWWFSNWFSKRRIARARVKRGVNRKQGVSAKVEWEADDLKGGWERREMFKHIHRIKTLDWYWIDTEEFCKVSSSFYYYFFNWLNYTKFFFFFFTKKITEKTIFILWCLLMQALIFGRFHFELYTQEQKRKQEVRLPLADYIICPYLRPAAARHYTRLVPSHFQCYAGRFKQPRQHIRATTHLLPSRLDDKWHLSSNTERLNRDSLHCASLSNSKFCLLTKGLNAE